ncbi:MAG TPA: CocE/NonD family hydrolase, partial [Steroidobacteraceae bacterium]|nr:CocE/NonD family hydrolase [Steroidobacteraceae bacterium]
MRSVMLLVVAGTVPAFSDPTLSNETPAAFVPRVDSFDYTKREVMIPMRDGIKLQTVILIPRGAHRAPILLSRTPYGATSRIAKNASEHLDALLDNDDV